jgi:7-cyano-7-deazaguanine synthase
VIGGAILTSVERRSAAVLLSGGIDSAVALGFLRAEGWSAEALFIDFGQPAVKHERQASKDIASALKTPWEQLEVHPLEVRPFVEMPGRNDMMIGLAAAARPRSHVATGVHGGTGYVDCSPAHVAAWQSVFDVQYGGARRLLAPLLDFTKVDVLRLAMKLEVPLERTWSCEASQGPCGICPSCRDRNIDVA